MTNPSGAGANYFFILVTFAYLKLAFIIKALYCYSATVNKGALSSGHCVRVAYVSQPCKYVTSSDFVCVCA